MLDGDFAWEECGVSSGNSESGASETSAESVKEMQMYRRYYDRRGSAARKKTPTRYSSIGDDEAISTHTQTQPGRQY